MSLKLRMMQAYYAQQQAMGFPDRLGLMGVPVPRAIAARLGVTHLASSWLGPVVAILTLILWIPAFVDFNASLWLFTGLGFLLAILGLRFPIAGLFGIGILMAVDPVTRIYLNETSFYRFNTLNYWLLIVIILNIPFLLRLSFLQFRILEALTLLMALQVIYTINISRGAQQVLDIAVAFGVFVYISRAQQEKNAFFWLAVILGLFSGIGGLIYNLRFEELRYMNPNSWAFFPVAAMFAICLGFHQSRESFRKIALLLVLFGVNYSWVFLSGSRGNMLTGLVCFLFILWQVRKMTWTPLALAAAVFLAYWLSTQLPDQFLYAMSKMDKTFNPDATLDERSSGRSTIVEGGIQIFLNNPLGVGTGSFRDQYAEISRYGIDRPAHTAWVTAMTENGIPGIVLLGGFVVSFIYLGFKRHRQGFFMLGILMTGTLTSVFISKEIGSKAVWMLAMAGLVMLNEEAIRRAIPVKDPLRVLGSFTHLRERWLTGNQQDHSIQRIP